MQVAKTKENLQYNRMQNKKLPYQHVKITEQS